MRFVKKYPIIEVIYHTLFTYPTPINLTYLWNFGSLALFFLVVQIITGIFLAMHYIPDAFLAFNSVEHIMRDLNYGWLLRYLHSNGASMFFFVVYIHIFRGLYYSSYIIPREILWCSGVIILLIMILTAFMGYVLPWGQMSFWAATVITNLASAIPFEIGNYIVIWLWGGFSVSSVTLNRFFSLHYLFPFILTFLVLLHLIFLHENGSNNLTGIGFKIDNIGFGTYFLWKDLFGVFLFLFFFLFFVFYLPNYLGHTDNYILANPLVTPTHIVPEWYFLPFYAILRSVPDKLFGVLLLLASILILLLLPFFFKLNRRSFFFKPIFKIFFWFFVINCIFLGWLGGKPIEYPFLQLGQITTIFYFFFFIFLLPFLSFVELKVWVLKFFKLNYWFEKKIGALTLKSYAFKSRSWELNSIESIDIFDSLNSNIRIDFYNMNILRILPKLNYFLNKEWISDSVRFSYDSLYLQRLLNPWLLNKKKYIEIDLKTSFFFLKKKIMTFKNTNELLINLGPNIDLFSFFYIKQFFNYLGNENIISNLCFKNIFSNFRTFYYLENNFNNIKNFFLVNLNIRKEIPLFNLNLLDEKKKKKKIFYIGNIISNLNYDYFFLGNSLLYFFNCFLGRKKVSSFFLKKSLILVSSTFNQIEKFFFFFNKFNYINLMIKMFNINNSDLHSNEINILSNSLINIKKINIIYNLNNINFFNKDCFKIYQGTHGFNNNKINLLIPSSSHFEKKLFYINIYGYIQKTFIIFNEIFNLKSNFSIFFSLYEFYNLYISFSQNFFIFFYLNLNEKVLRNFFHLNLNKKKITFSFNVLLIKNTSMFILNNWTKASKIIGIASQIFLKKKKNF